MPNAPANPRAEADLLQERIVPVVLMGAAGGGAPLRPLLMDRSAGGREMDRVVFDSDLGEKGVRLTDHSVREEWNRIVELRMLGDDDEATGHAVFWGELVVQQYGIDERGERYQLQAIVPPYLFGDPVNRLDVYDPLTDQVRTLHRPIVFNPEIDGIIEPNRSPEQQVETWFTDESYWVWLDPESVRTDRAVVAQGLASGQTAAEWTLAQAVHTIVNVANPIAKHVRHPKGTDLDEILVTAPAVKDVRLPLGRYMPELLDRLLEPHGYSWYLAYSLDDSDSVLPTVRVFPRGDGPEKELHFQRPGETLDPAKSDVPVLDVEVSVADLANVVIGLGSHQEREVTIELYRGWPTADDGLLPDTLAKDDPDESSYNTKPWVWRAWVANEAGDYSGLRDSGVETIPSTPLDLSDVLDEYVPRRRVLGPCLTRDENGRRREPFIEATVDGGSSWFPVPPEWGATLMGDQIGVLFTANKPPETFAVEKDNIKVRVTGTVVGDARLESEAERRDSSPNVRDVKLVLDLAHRFHDRQRQATGTFASLLSDTDVDEADDQEALDTFVEDARDVEDSAVISATFELFGVHFGYEIGDLLTKVAGRELSLNRNAPSSETKRYLQITRLRTDFQQQRTLITAEPTPPPPDNLPRTFLATTGRPMTLPD